MGKSCRLNAWGHGPKDNRQEWVYRLMIFYDCLRLCRIQVKVFDLMLKLISVLWETIPYNQAKVSRRFGGTCRLNLQSWKEKVTENFLLTLTSSLHLLTRKLWRFYEIFLRNVGGFRKFLSTSCTFYLVLLQTCNQYNDSTHIHSFSVKQYKFSSQYLQYTRYFAAHICV